MANPESTEASFADQVRGTSPQAVDLVLPSLLQDLYAAAKTRDEPSSGSPASLPEGWTRLSEEQLLEKGIKPSALHDAESGFDAAFYQDAAGHVVLGFCGTDELRDWPHNIGQGLGIQDAQYDEAMNLAREAKLAFGDDLVLTGHSLGGGLAAAASMITNTPAVTYNAAGVNNRTLEREGLDGDAAKEYAKDGLIRAYHVDNEILTYLQEDALLINHAMPDPAGHQIKLPDPDPLSTLEHLVPGRMLKHRLDLHGIESVMESQDLAQLRAQAAQPQATTRQDDTANTLVRDAVSRLSPERARLGLQDDARFLSAATGVAAQAGADGMTRIDHLVPDARGHGVFAVQGRLDDPAHQRRHVELDAIAPPTMKSNTEQLREQSRRVSAQQAVDPQQQAAPRHAMA